jgi:hypothetical protein
VAEGEAMAHSVTLGSEPFRGLTSDWPFSLIATLDSDRKKQDRGEGVVMFVSLLVNAMRCSISLCRARGEAKISLVQVIGKELGTRAAQMSLSGR